MHNLKLCSVRFGEVGETARGVSSVNNGCIPNVIAYGTPWHHRGSTSPEIIHFRCAVLSSGPLRASNMYIEVSSRTCACTFREVQTRHVDRMRRSTTCATALGRTDGDVGCRLRIHGWSIRVVRWGHAVEDCGFVSVFAGRPGKGPKLLTSAPTEVVAWSSRP